MGPWNPEGRAAWIWAARGQWRRRDPLFPGRHQRLPPPQHPLKGPWRQEHNQRFRGWAGGCEESLPLTAGTRPPVPQPPPDPLAAPGGVRGHRSVGRLNKQTRWRRGPALGGGGGAFPAFRASRAPTPRPGRGLMGEGRESVGAEARPGGPGRPPAPRGPGVMSAEREAPSGRSAGPGRQR